MAQGNQNYFETLNETVERYALVGVNFKWYKDESTGLDVKIYNGERILGVYKDIKSVKSALKWVNKNYYLEIKIIKVNMTIEELEEITL